MNTIKAYLIEHDENNGKVLKRRVLDAWSAHNGKPKSINIVLNDADENGICRDVVVDLKSLIEVLKHHELV